MLFLPIPDAIVDYSHLRKQMMRLFATIGALATIGLFAVTGSLWWLSGLLFILANLTFGAAIVFYNAYLPDITSEDQRDRVSSYALVMGGSQAISLSLFAQMIPKGSEAEFYLFYEVSERGTSWIGLFLFGFVNQAFGSLLVNVKKAMADVKKYDDGR